MVHLRFRSDTDVMRLDGISRTGYGVEALRGVTGFGLPPVSTQWRAGAGDGAAYRGERKQPRDIDIPLHIFAPDREALEREKTRLSLVLMQGEFDLDVVEDGGAYWTTRVVRVGGGDIAYGDGTTGDRELTTIVTLRAGYPYFTSHEERCKEVTNAGAGRGLLGAGFSLVALKISGSQAIGDMLLVNDGDAVTWPVWRIVGPGQDLVVSDGSRAMKWLGALSAGEELIINTRASTVRTLAGTNRYSELAPAPRFWPLPPGQTLARVSMVNTTGESAIRATWRPRKWWVI